MIVSEGARIVADRGIAALSAREIARQIGYSVTTVLSAMGGTEQIITAVNTRTFRMWAAELERALALKPSDRIAALVNAYFDFATRNPRLWIAIYEHHLPIGHVIPADQAAARRVLTGLVVREVQAALPPGVEGVEELTASLIHTVHGHCHLWITGSSDLMGVRDVRACALERVRDSLKAKGT